MDLIKGNALMFIALSAATAFIILWEKLNQGTFRRAFIHSRKANMRYELTLMVKLLSAVSIVAVMIYYTLSYFLRIETKSIWQVVYLVLFVLAVYFIVANRGAIANNAILAGVLLLGVLVLPSVAITAALVWGVQLDRYCHIFSLVLLLLNVILGYKSVAYWKRGDLR